MITISEAMGPTTFTIRVYDSGKDGIQQPFFLKLDKWRDEEYWYFTDECKEWCIEMFGDYPPLKYDSYTSRRGNFSCMSWDGDGYDDVEYEITADATFDNEDQAIMFGLKYLKEITRIPQQTLVTVVDSKSDDDVDYAKLSEYLVWSFAKPYPNGERNYNIECTSITAECKEWCTANISEIPNVYYDQTTVYLIFNDVVNVKPFLKKWV